MTSIPTPPRLSLPRSSAGSTSNPSSSSSSGSSTSGNGSAGVGGRLLAGRYQVGELIGRGGMADVHLGMDTRLGRRIAIKMLKPSLATDPRFRLMFREEAQKAARMAHPTIVRVFDAGEETISDAGGDRHIPYIVMEYVDGRLLKDIIAEGPLDPSEAVRIIAQVLTALEYSHRALLVHRDIKPGNIMITQSGQVKVMDFGIARAVSDNSATVAETGAILGTAQYFSPEQARGETVDARTDLYSTGVIFFELLTGRAPFRGERAAAVAYQHISEPPVAPSSINPQVSPALDAVVLHSLNKDKFERYQTAAEFRADVETAGAGHVPTRRVQTPDFSTALFGVNPAASSGSESTLRQLSSNDNARIVRTQTRPPVAWIWASFLVIIAVLAAVLIWVVNLPTVQPGLTTNLSVQVPDVSNSAYDAGAATLTGLGLTTTQVQQASETVPEGQIISTDPSAGTRVSSDQAITVFVSTGRVPTTVPTLDGQAEDAARQALVDRKLEGGATNVVHSATVAAGTVVDSSPASGTAVREGDTVDLNVSDGLVDVPSLVGLSLEDATGQLDALVFDVTPQPDYTCETGNVTEQSLAPGVHPQRSAISIAFCAG